MLERALRRPGRVAGRGQRVVARARAEEPQRRLERRQIRRRPSGLDVHAAPEQADGLTQLARGGVAARGVVV